MRVFKQVDVFTEVPLLGNPVAVVLNGDGLTDAEMARFARWTNLSETTFVLPPTTVAADYRVRIFTPAEELPFAGHPTLGTCHAWLEAGGSPARSGVVVQECGVGLVTIRRADTLAFAAPPLIRSGPLDDDTFDQTLTVLGVDRDQVEAAAWIDNGPGWVGVRLADADQLLALTPTGIGDLKIGVVAPHRTDGPADYEVRAFFGVAGTTREDPVTGSLNASLAQWMLGNGVATAPYTVRQGTVLQRDGRVTVEQADGEIWVGGATITVVDGTVSV